MSLSRRRFTQEFKLAAVERLEQGASAAEVSRAFEVNPNLLHRWRRELRQGRGNAFPGEGKRRWEETRSAEPAAASPTGSYYEPKGRRWPAKTSERSTVSKLFVSPRGQVQFAVRGSKARPQELSTSEFQLRASFRSGLSGILLVSLKCPCRGRFQVH